MSFAPWPGRRDGKADSRRRPGHADLHTRLYRPCHGFSRHHQCRLGELHQIHIDVGRSLAYHGFKKIIFLNGHGSNTPNLDLAARRVNLETDAECIACNWWHLLTVDPEFMKNWRASKFPGGCAHACELETSVNWPCGHPPTICRAAFACWSCTTFPSASMSRSSRRYRCPPAACRILWKAPGHPSTCPQERCRLRHYGALQVAPLALTVDSIFQQSSISRAPRWTPVTQHTRWQGGVSQSALAPCRQIAHRPPPDPSSTAFAREGRATYRS